MNRKQLRFLLLLFLAGVVVGILLSQPSAALLPVF